MKKWRPNKTVKFIPALALTFGALAPMPASASIVEECFDDQCTIVFGYTGQIESLTLPDNAIDVRFEVLGAQGGKTGGGGGRVTGTFIEVPEILYITVGGAGGSNSAAPGGFNGGGTAGGSAGVEGSGGGASDVRTGLTLSSRIVVAGGGGGRGSGLGSGGGAGGGLSGAQGKTGQGAGGLGGTQSAGGLGGATNGKGTPGTRGVLGLGGTGGSGPLHGGGGGGGGYYGGGGGGADSNSCCTDAGGGGGGSSFTSPAFVADVTHSQGVQQGAGKVTISYQLVLEEVTTSPTEQPLVPPTEEPSAPPAGPTEQPLVPPTEEPSTPPAGPTEQPLVPPTEEPSTAPIDEPPIYTIPELDYSNEEQEDPKSNEPESAPSEPEVPEPVLATPEPEQSTSLQEGTQFPEQSSPAGGIAAGPAKDVEALLAIELDKIETPSGAWDSVSELPEDQVIDKGPQKADGILARAPNLRQAAQTVVVPDQTRLSLWNSISVLAGFLGISIFALIAGLVVARRGVPGAIAS